MVVEVKKIYCGWN